MTTTTNPTTTTTEPTEGQKTESGSDAPTDVREHKAFKAVARQAEEARAELKALREAIEKEKAEKAAAEAIARGDFESVKQSLESRIAELESASARRDVELAMRARLAEIGVTEKYRVAGILAEYLGLPADERPDLVEYTSAIAPDPKAGAGKLPAPPSTQAAPSGSQDWAQVKADLRGTNGRDAAKATAARQIVEAYVKQHGSLPPGIAD
jgi:hypothetical protein